MLAPRGRKMPIMKANGAQDSLKYGGPTEICSPRKTSIINGQIVPKKITNAETVRSKLLKIKPLSRLYKPNTALPEKFVNL